MLSGYMLSIHSLLPHLLAIPWFPLVIMSFLKYFNTNKKKYLVYASIFLSMEFLAGAPEIVMMTALVLFVLLFFPDSFPDPAASKIHKDNKRKISVIHRFGALLVVIVLFLLVSSVQLLPFLELKSQSIRSGGLHYLEATTWSFGWKDFIQFFLPDAFGYFKTTERYWSNQSWLKTVYLGITPFVLSIFFFVSKDRKRWIFLSLMVISFIFALGGNTPVYHLLHKIPPFNSIRYPVKFLFLFFFVISITSGMGLDKLIEGVKSNSAATRKLIQIVFYTGFFFAAFWGYLYLFDADVYVFLDKNSFKPPAYNDIWFNLHNAKRFLLFAFLFCAMVLVYLRIKNKKAILSVLALIIVSDLFLANYGFYHSERWDQYMMKSGFEDALPDNSGTERYFVTGKTTKDFQLFLIDKITMNSAYAALFPLYTIDGVEVMRTKHHNTFLTVMNSTPTIVDAKRFFDMSGVRHVITSYKVDDEDLKLVKSVDVADKTAYLYEYTKCPGRFLLYSKVSFARDDGEVIERFQYYAFDPREELILQKSGVNSPSDDRLPSSPLTLTLSRQGRGDKVAVPQGDKVAVPQGDKVAAPPGDMVAAPLGDMVAGEGGYDGRAIDAAKNKDVQGRVKLLSYKANRFSLEYESDGDAFLYVSDTYYPGWRAYVDGKETKIYRANLAFRAIEAPKGKHTVVFRYVPMSFYTGLALTIIGILLCIWLWRRDKPAESKELRTESKNKIVEKKQQPAHGS